MNRNAVAEIYFKPIKNLLFEAQRIHAQNFDTNEMQLSALLSIKTGGCPENCGYCPQSAHYKTSVKRDALMLVDDVRKAALRAKNLGASRFCLGAAWREINDGPEFDRVLEMIGEVRALDLEVCCTLGMLTQDQAIRLKVAGLHAYNHNIDSSRAFYQRVITTRTYDDRLTTIKRVRAAGITVCTGGIIGMGESDDDRIDFLDQLASFKPAPESVTINVLIPIPGTPLGEAPPVEPIEVARVIATARCLMPTSRIRLSAGRARMSDEAQLVCFLAGANSIFLGNKLLTAVNPEPYRDERLIQDLGLKPKRPNS